MKRIICFALVVMMLACCFVSCSDKNDDTAAETTTVAVAETTAPDASAPETEYDPTKDENGFLKDDLPDELDYGGDVVNVIHWKAERDEFYIPALTGDNIGDAIYTRNLNIEERLGVKLNFIEEQGSYDYLESFTKTIANSYNSGSKSYDIIATYGRTAGKVAVEGFFTDLDAIDNSYLNFEKPWWSDSLLDTVKIGDAVYYVSGDASTNTLHMMYTIYYNQQLLENYGLEDPTKYVIDHTWTIDKLMSMASNTYQDLDGDGKLSAQDLYGFGSINYGCTAFYTGSGLKLLENTGDENLLRLSPDYNSEKAINLIDKLGEWFHTQDCYVEGATAAGDNVKLFAEGRCLFDQNRVYIADNRHSCKLNSVEWKYGLVPTPLYDENQSDYITVIANPFTLYGICNDCDSMEEMTAVIECWGSEAYRLTTPALFETNMKYKYTDLDISAQMFDILRRTSTYDQGRIFDRVINGLAENTMKCACSGASWAVQAKSYSKSYEKLVKTLIVEPFKKIQGN